MVAKKKNAAEGDLPKGTWAKSPAAGQEQMEFDPSRVAGILSGKSGEQLDQGSAADAPAIEANADTEGWQAPFRDGYSEDQFNAEYQQVEETLPAPPPATKPGKKAAKDKNRAPVENAPPPRDTNGELTAIVERVERLMEEGQAVRDDIKEVMGEAKSTGFDTATIRKVIAYRAKDPEKLAEQEALFDTYFHAVGPR